MAILLRGVATRGLHVVAAADVYHDNEQQGCDANHDCGHLHPTWRARVAKWSTMGVACCCGAVVEMDARSETRQYVRNLVNERRDANVRYGTIRSI